MKICKSSEFIDDENIIYGCSLRGQRNSFPCDWSADWETLKVVWRSNVEVSGGQYVTADGVTSMHGSCADSSTTRELFMLQFDLSFVFLYSCRLYSCYSMTCRLYSCIHVVCIHVTV